MVTVPSLVNIVLTVLLSVLGTSSCFASSLLSDYEVLVTLKQGFEFRGVPALSSWNSSSPSSVCSWGGIGCSRGGRVVSVDLTDLGLSGSVSPALISRLDQLVHLSLAGNNFSGSIEIGNLTNLRFLNISANQFDGGLHWNYSSIPNLQVLDAYDNSFAALLPLGISSLKKLRHLDLGGNYFYGTIPPSYGSLVGLEYLSLSGNDLQGKIPGELANLTGVREIYLGHYNVFEGGIPAEFGKLVDLVVLDISSCGLEGPIPHGLGNLKALDTLYLHTNLLSGSIPRQIGNLTSLVYLDLSNNMLTGEIPLEFANLKRLKLFNLFMNRLHGSIPDYIAGEFRELETMGLWMNNFTGIIPQKLGQNGRLQVLDLSSNKLTGTIPPNLCSSSRLRILILLNNFLLGPIPEGLGACSSLTRVRLGQNYLNGSIPDGLIYLPLLNLAELQNNYLSGSLSDASSSLSSSLAHLNLSNNLLSGPLPTSLSKFPSLQILLLSGNQFSGPIPASIGQLHHLQKLDISHNSLSGQIPPEIANCTFLTYLDLSQNNLSGPVPSEISNIRNLNYLNLSRNHLNQTIPRSIGGMKTLTTADFSFNDFSGKLPESGQFSLFNASSFAGNPHLCGSLLNNPCNLSAMGTPRKAAAADFKLIFAVGLLVCSLVFAAAAIVKAKSFKSRNGGGGRPESWKMTAFQKVEFKVSDVLECVKDGNVIGRGGAGIVYHGKMPNGVEVAVKKLVGMGHDHGFRAEIQTLGNIRHRNIVRLLAFCSNKDTNLLVYEYMRNGSLGEALHGKKGSLLGWNLRYKIAIEAARGLCYLHHDCSPLIVHRDVKSNNILLNSTFEAHVADFGLAKFLFQGGGASECMSAIAGSYGYIAPEYAYTLRVDEKSDVYSYGVVLLELLTGRRPVGGEFGEGVDIVQWCKKATSNWRREELVHILDPRLSSSSSSSSAASSNSSSSSNSTSQQQEQQRLMHLFFIAMLCIQDNSVERPTMRDVVHMLSEFHPNSSSSSSPNPSPNNKHHL
ncbi:hypothetical protein FEM48_Zijuj02G0205200 [Ziziphus jujuba var. spinosa]|uniref:non-specific serine/threonine protein kinase n=1 Tax=Ziziphus jujuba var. spinosa TaxID=714518 RepID=A0A978VXU3_ZIZJJ|nr:hypothetical protein FEM48_Zijuj02G0205200 [Ziziphus jujuba var. spinosa]